MRRRPIFLWGSVAFLLGGFIFGYWLPEIHLSATAEAAPSSLVKRLKRKVRQLRRQLRAARSSALTSASTSTPMTPGMRMVPAGTFLMGDETNGLGAGDPDELPVHSVMLAFFYMDQFEVTKELWETVRAWGLTNGYDDLPAGAGRGEFHPVNSIDWYAAVKWCNARSEMEGLTPVYHTNATWTTVYRTGSVDLETSHVNWNTTGFRLPTEAEWEYAARGGLANMGYPWGNSWVEGDANFGGSLDPFEPGTTPVGFYDGKQVPAGANRANGYGLYDMAGNLEEWCWDWYSATYYASSPGTDPRGPGASTHRTVRGGNWIVSGQRIRCAERQPVAANDQGSVTGFRTVRSK